MMRVFLLAFVLFHLPGMASVYEIRFKNGALERSWISMIMGPTPEIKIVKRPYVSEALLSQLDARILKMEIDFIVLSMTEAAAAILRNSHPNWDVRLLY